jgi:glycosyltransferase involved in cell wall biosynthesis
LGAEVYFHPWQDSFATARNDALNYATGDWIFWMDSDDVLPPECGAQLKETIAAVRNPGLLGFVMKVRCPHLSDDGTTDWTYVDHVKIFRNRPDLRWEFRIHEQILPSIRRAGGDVGGTDLYVVHAGSDQTPEGKRRKLERDYRLLELELRDRPDHPFALFNLGMTHNDCGRHEEAAEVFARARLVGADGDSHMASSSRFGSEVSPGAAATKRRWRVALKRVGSILTIRN